MTIRKLLLPTLIAAVLATPAAFAQSADAQDKNAQDKVQTQQAKASNADAAKADAQKDRKQDAKGKAAWQPVYRLWGAHSEERHLRLGTTDADGSSGLSKTAGLHSKTERA